MPVKPMRIVHCFRSPVGGIFRHVRDLAAAQAKKGHSVGIVCDSSTGGAYEDRLFAALSDTLALGAVRVPMQRHIGIGDLSSAMATYRAVKAMAPDIVHGHGAKGGVYARLFGTMMRRGSLRPARFYSPHGGSLHYDADTWTGRMFFAIERQLERVTDCLMFVSGYEQQTYHEKIGTPRCAFRLIYNGVSEAEFEPVKPVDNPADFLFIGMMRDLKGPDIFLEALEAAARSTGKRLTAHMVGDGPDKPALVAQASAEGFPAQIEFHEPMPAREAFAMADTVVIPSRAEAMPYIVLEGLAGGKPMIASRVGGIPEVFGDQSIALIEPVVASLTAKMIEVLTAPGPFRQAMPDRQWLHDRFSVVAMSDGVETAYSDAISRQI